MLNHIVIITHGNERLATLSLYAQKKGGILTARYYMEVQRQPRFSRVVNPIRGVIIHYKTI